MNVRTLIVSVLVVVCIIPVISLLVAFPVKWTWNATMPFIWGLPIITWGKAWCLIFLAGCLIKSTNIK